jgi:3-oxoacyl-[acyl-carrier protein] reductase
MKQEQKKQD